MLELLESYSLTDILIFIVLICMAAKQTIDFIDWAKKRFRKGYEKEAELKNSNENIQAQIDQMNETFSIKEKRFEEKKKEIFDQFKALESQIKSLIDSINLLISSDRDDIKAYITEKHHFFCYTQKWIDDYSLDCIEKRYKHYEDEGGNSFVADLMKDIRRLSKVPPQQ